MNPITIQRVVETALDEDLGWGDLSTEAVVHGSVGAQATITARTGGVIAGSEVAREVFRRLDPGANYRADVEDGQRFDATDVVARVEGRIDALLSGERVALNFLTHLSGIATVTRRIVDALGNLPVRIIDTRKTTPGLRALEKYAVRMGGGFNHRFDLSGGVLLKENHIAAAGGIGNAVSRAKDYVGHTILVQVEVTDREGVRQALEIGADALLLDNMSIDAMREAVEMVGGRIPVEASGGIEEGTLLSVAQTGVDLISMGFLTHSAPAVDLSMILEASNRWT
ncbi:MAG: carboxylating nicotinate-nucleotide diphosphorylase [Bacillota bacterium]